MTRPDIPSDRGVLRPESLPEFHRLPAIGATADLVRWFWICRWQLPTGRVSRQEVIGFGALNLVVQHDHVVVAGATTRISHRDLAGTGWAVGALLRPAAAGALPIRPAEHLDTVTVVSAPDLHAAVSTEMTTGMGSPPDPAAAAETVGRWLRARASLTDEALLANRAVTALESDPALIRVDQSAELFGISERTLQRLTAKYVGLSPAALIRRRRLQEAAHRVRTRPDESLAEIAAELGYTDHAHMTRDFASVLGFTPSRYRAGG
ncbi:helix-turn-helix domain-containing protein [Gordonia sp. LUNF6]|uniref:AraC family transcriptional regulator n=1 Tax=Gordonia sp. LUNF6 TaxID=3388658 RepID=UPI00399AF31A